MGSEPVRFEPTVAAFSHKQSSLKKAVPTTITAERSAHFFSVYKIWCWSSTIDFDPLEFGTY
ncbi:predicted protein [Sclerotinia sclerotiorum 1980 UF-70]|uniref:Uncharacterized protein n=2 Tax=Sclerotinia sclerotiorum (strain ATCC 18683 / 1980 / Ss-1) TaxID=665079 RepID=A7F0B6_SCLS1|nr:predicted protein [Sclerotinia sclerotiorum 1980 UF-70]APA14125.1 hypothetical protein sscle_12g088950 [Sclerotinia sclerotiorum 1980 UF-70]EDN95158.1 predicted protein [Sclerotinia sclerotiorum 1980 UF-70]